MVTCEFGQACAGPVAVTLTHGFETQVTSNVVSSCDAGTVTHEPVVAASTLAWLVTRPMHSGAACTSKLIVQVAPNGRSNAGQVMAEPFTCGAPTLQVELTLPAKVRPGGRSSSTIVELRSLSPRFCSVSVNRVVLPTQTRTGFAIFVILTIGFGWMLTCGPTSSDRPSVLEPTNVLTRKA